MVWVVCGWVGGCLGAGVVSSTVMLVKTIYIYIYVYIYICMYVCMYVHASQVYPFRIHTSG